MAKKTTTRTKSSIGTWLRKWGKLIIISLAVAIIVIDTTLLNVSIGVIVRELHTDINGIQWVITAYALTLAALTITGGRLGDLFGRKKMFIVGAVLFAIGSFMASVSHSLGSLLIGESIVEGIGAALMMPAASALIIGNFSGRDRAISFGVFGGVAGAASAVGPILGGWLTSTYSWRWGFRINVVVALVLIIGSVLISESRDTEERPTLDMVGVLLSSTGLFSLVFGIIEASKYGWWTAKETFMIHGFALGIGNFSITPIAITIGLLLLLAFMNWERIVEAGHKTPLVSTKLLANKQFVSGATTLMLVSLGLIGLIFALPIFFQGVRGQDSLHTGLSLLPLSISLFIAGPFSVFLSQKFFTPKRIVQMGLVLTVAGILLMRLHMGVDSTVSDLLTGFILFGVGMGFVQAQINNITLSAVSVQEAGEASGVSSTARQVGGSFGSAILGAILLTTLAANITRGINVSLTIPQDAKPKVNAAVQAQSTNVEFGGGPDLAGSKISPALTQEIKEISAEATTDAVNYTLIFAALFAGLSLLASTRLPNISNVETSESVAVH